MSLALNRESSSRWKEDIAMSIESYNRWYMKTAPKAAGAVREEALRKTKKAFKETGNLRDLTAAEIIAHPDILAPLRMATSPVLSRARLATLAGVSPSLIRTLENGTAEGARLSPRRLKEEGEKIVEVLKQMVDPDVCSWVGEGTEPSAYKVTIAVHVVADRLSQVMSASLLRQMPEEKQLGDLVTWLKAKGYRELSHDEEFSLMEMPEGTYTFRRSVPVTLKTPKGPSTRYVSVDALVKPMGARAGSLPVMIEAKAAGDTTNTLKRMKEEAQKMSQLSADYGDVPYLLLLFGHFDEGYLSYEGSHGIDWAWSHRLGDLEGVF